MTSDKMKSAKVVFVGGGNMATALVHGMVSSGTCPRSSIVVSDISPERIEFFKKEAGVGAVGSNREAVAGADIVVLAVKPQVMDVALGELKGHVPGKALVVSIAAGITTGHIEEKLGEGTRVVRVMPNTPALVRAGAAALCGGRWATIDDLQITQTMMEAVGVAVRVSEPEMDAVTALSGSGPAYVFCLIEAMLQAARELKLEDEVARKLVYATVGGAAKLISETGVGAAELRQRVTSKGGTTAAAVAVLDKAGTAATLVKAILAAHHRSKELSGNA